MLFRGPGLLVSCELFAKMTALRAKCKPTTIGSAFFPMQVAFGISLLPSNTNTIAFVK